MLELNSQLASKKKRNFKDISLTLQLAAQQLQSVEDLEMISSEKLDKWIEMFLELKFNFDSQNNNT